MLKSKQIDGLNDLAKMAITNMELSADSKTVTLTRADGEKFTFITRSGDGIKGETGDKGATGARGESAYDIAKRLALTNATTSSAWLTSLKGDKGPNGANGTAGATGDAGANGSVPSFTIGTTSWLAAGSAPTLDISQSGTNYTLNFGVPNGANGTAASNGTKPTLQIGTVTMGTTNGGNASASLSQNGNTYSLNMTIPKGSKGADATAGSGGGANGYAPQIAFNVNYVSHGNSPSVSYSGSQGTAGSDWTRTVTLNIPKGETGDTGDRGAQGSNGSYTSANPFFEQESNQILVPFPGKGMSALLFDWTVVDHTAPTNKVLWFGFCWNLNGTEKFQLVYPANAPGYSAPGNIYQPFVRFGSNMSSAQSLNSYDWIGIG